MRALPDGFYGVVREALLDGECKEFPSAVSLNALYRERQLLKYAF